MIIYNKLFEKLFKVEGNYRDALEWVIEAVERSNPDQGPQE